MGPAREVLRAVCGVQAQLLPAAGLAIRARSRGLTALDIEDAMARERSIVRGWLMRGTLHLVDAEDYGWLLSLLGPIFLRADARRRAQLGLGDEVVATGIHLLRRILASAGPMTRAELMARLAKSGLVLDQRSQAPIHLIAAAAHSGVLCLGPPRGRNPTYVLLEDWIGRPSAPRRELALAELARRYLLAYGPATVEDLAAWSGIPLAVARTALAAVAHEQHQVEVSGRSAWLPLTRAGELRSAARRGFTVRLLPSFDTYLLGYASRALATAPSIEARLQRGGGWIHPSVIIDGRAAGTWRLERKGGIVELVVEAEWPSGVVQKALQREVRDVGRFLSLRMVLHLAAPDPTERRS